MIPLNTQQSMAKRLLPGLNEGFVKEAFDENAVSHVDYKFDNNTTEDSAVLFVDIAGFSGLVAGLSPAEIQLYLEAYYADVLRHVYAFGGFVDRLVGDGVLAVFSPLFEVHGDFISAQVDALRAAETIVGEKHGTAQECKAAIGVGPLVYCKPGLASVYRLPTVLGEAITIAYRLEEQCVANQVVVPAQSHLADVITADLIRSTVSRVVARHQGLPVARPAWIVKEDEWSLRGVSSRFGVVVENHVG